jgi:hypothetical protein
MPKLEISKIHDAYREGGECPLCSLLDAAERTYLRSFQHSRLMEPNVRVQTNAKGFCPPHWDRLYRQENRLGTALMAHTHLQEQRPWILSRLESIQTAAGAASGTAPRAASAATPLRVAAETASRSRGGRRSRLPCNSGSGRAMDAAIRDLSDYVDRCFLCDLLAMDGARYRFTVIYLWKKDPEFLPVFRASRGFCVSHFLDVLAEARRALNPADLARWLEDAVPLMAGSLERLEGEVEGFTRIHRHESTEPVGEKVRTALARTLQKMAGRMFRPGEGGGSP